jgi:predicted alpha/beta-fold hydrolase
MGWGAFALNFRSCSGEPNRLPRSYHSGETGDALNAIARIRQRVTGPLFGVGFSLGGNVLLVLMAKAGAQAPLDAAAAISVPYDLQKCARALDTSGGFGRVYGRYFLRSLKGKAIGKLKRHPGALDAARIHAAQGIESFDEAVTAPLHGFASAAQYYRQSSSGPLIARIQRPTLLISSTDDPLVPLPPPADAIANPWVTALLTEHGGHVGFVSGTLWRPRYWAEKQALHFLSSQLL